MYPPVRLLALHWSLENLPVATAHRICSDRVIGRGDNHQTLRADEDERKHEEVIWEFLRTSEDLSESEVDASVNMDVTEDLEHAVNRAVEACVNVLGVPRPSSEKISEGLRQAKRYAVATKRQDGKAGGKRATPRYFGLLPEVDLQDLIQRRFGLGDVSDESRSFWRCITENSRVQKRPHVTIVHQGSLPQESELWDRCMRLVRLPSLPLFKMKLGKIIWTDRVMVITVDWLEADRDDGRKFISTLPRAVANRLHITVATRDSEVKAVEGKALVEAWRSGRADTNVQSAELGGMIVCGRLSGLFG
jgi:tRNA ligase